jgi:hypothetical protein
MKKTTYIHHTFDGSSILPGVTSSACFYKAVEEFSRIFSRTSVANYAGGAR